MANTPFGCSLMDYTLNTCVTKIKEQTQKVTGDNFVILTVLAEFQRLATGFTLTYYTGIWTGQTPNRFDFR